MSKQAIALLVVMLSGVIVSEGKDPYVRRYLRDANVPF